MNVTHIIAALTYENLSFIRVSVRRPKTKANHNGLPKPLIRLAGGGGRKVD